MDRYQNKQGDIVTLTNESATNKYGNKLLWVRCENASVAGRVVSVFEDKFNKEFTKIA